MIAFPWFRRRPLDPIAERYRAGTPRRISPKVSLEEIAFVVLDAETSGFDPTQDRVLSLAIVRVKAGILQVASLRSWLIYQEQAPLTPAVSVHGILPSESRTGERQADVLAELLPAVTGAVLVGHHVAFDVAI